MNKNLKKVLSAVAALAISASAVSALAVDFPDVPEDASYYQAVQELSALDVISGYDEDGTFRPDELVTRAQMSKMVVDALNHRELAEASKASTPFQDVSADHWAKGFINQGVADKFIEGYSDTEFGPEDNVTYVQAQVMLVCATGYKTYAEGSGGWPNGYKTWANSQGITTGISGIADDQQLTRAQVAQLIDNAMSSPICVIKDYETTWDGRQVPNLEIKDKEGKEYQTLFTKQHKAYKVFGRVTATSKTTSSLKSDQVTFRVEKADNFDDTYIKANNGDEVEEDMYFGVTKADQMLRTYAEALVQKNADDEWVILSIAPAAVNKSVTVLAEDADDSKSNVDGNPRVIYFYPAGTTRGSQKYELADTVDLYVNGVNMGSFNEDAYVKYIFNPDNETANDANIITLQKETKTGSTSTENKYNVVMVQTFGTAVVDTVSDKSDETKINFKERSKGIQTSMTVKKDDDNYSYSFKLNGESIDPTELLENDVLTISYDTNDFADSNFYDVLVSRETIEGKYTGVNSAGDEYTIGGTKYKKANGMELDFETSSEYTVYLDAFGRMAYNEELDSTKKLGILSSVYRKNNGDYVAEVITKDATKVEYNMDYDDDSATAMGAASVSAYFNNLYNNVKNTPADDDNDFKSYLKNTRDGYAVQVVEYKVNSSNKLTIKKFANALDPKPVEKEKYKSASNKIGSIKLSDASTIIDLSSTKNDNNKKVDEYSLITAESLKNDAEYSAVGYDKNNSDSTSRFVIILEGNQGIDSTSQLAVFLESGTDADKDGNDVDTITVLIDNKQKTYMIDDDYGFDPSNLVEGDLVVFSTNNEGEIDELIEVFADRGFVSGDYTDVRNTVYANAAKNSSETTKNLTAGLDQIATDADEDVNFYFGAVVNKSGSTYTFAPVQKDENDDYFVNVDGGIDITVGKDAKVYTYNFNKNKKNFGRITSDDGMVVTPDVRNAYEDQDKSKSKYFIDSEGVEGQVVFGVVRTFDTDEAQEVYLIVAE